jgi:cyanate permease
MWGSALGPVIAGFIYDQTQDYSSVLWGAVGTLTLSASLTALLIRSWGFKMAAPRSDQAAVVLGK